MTEPNGGEGENCGELKFDDWTGGRWNDFTCTGNLPFVCEKKGQNYVPPTPPGPPEPQCPEGWRKIRDRCLYLSTDSSQTAANWTEARAMCKGFHEGSNLVSIRDQTDQDAFYGTVKRNDFKKKISSNFVVLNMAFFNFFYADFVI